MNHIRPRVAVVGSLNIDYIASVNRLPAAGETVAASSLARLYGGKGANQAVAAARQGGAVSLIGSVGADDAGRGYRQRLHAEGVDVSGVSVVSGRLTGTALIAVERSAENLIIVAPEANGTLTPTRVRRHAHHIRSAQCLLLQFEVPMPAIAEAVCIANQSHVPVIVNPSPIRQGFSWGRCALDTFIVNESEAQTLFGRKVALDSTRLKHWRQAMVTRRIANLIITRGSRSTLFLTPGESGEVPVLAVQPVDTVGAGDAFAGAYAVRRAKGLDLKEAILYANCAGALATLKRGAQEAMPSRPETERAARKLRRQVEAG